jgi:hypothetical protein
MKIENSNLNIRRSLTIFVLVVGCLALLASAAAAEPATVSSSGPATAASGDEVTVSATITNTGENPSGFVGDVSLPDGWDVSGQTAEGAIWNNGDQSWLWQSIDPDTSVNPSITVAVPSNATAGSYDVEMAVKSNEGIEANTTHTVTISNESSSPTDGNEESETNDSLPGFGIWSAIMALCSVGFALRRGHDLKS